MSGVIVKVSNPGVTVRTVTAGGTTGTFRIESAADADFTDLANGQAIIWDSEQGKFINGNVASSITLNDTIISTSTTEAATANSVNAVYNYAQSVDNFASGAFAQANTAEGAAEDAQDVATAAFNEANSFQSVINSAFVTANLSFATANASFAEANSFQEFINSAYTTANAAFAEGNSFQSFINSAYTTANAAFVEANSFQAFINSAFALANSHDAIISSAYLEANNAANNATAAFAEANSFQGFINSAYTTANAAVVDATNAQNNAIAAFAEANSFQGFINSAYTTANAAIVDATNAQNNAIAAFAEANSFQSFINSAFALANSHDAIILSAYLEANNAANNATAAFAEANSFQGFINSAYTTANAAVVDATNAQNNAAAAFAEANSFQSVINSAFSTANSAITDAINAQNNAAAAFAEANSFQAYINSAYTTANAAFVKANNAGTGGALTVTYITDPGITVNGSQTLTLSGNGTVVLAANNATTAQSGIVQLNDNETSNSTTLAATANSVNTTWSYAQSAFIQANTATLDATNAQNNAIAAFAEANSFQAFINSAFLQANAAFAEGNSFQSFINSAFALANSHSAIISSAYLEANNAANNATAAFAEANSFQSFINSAYTQANTATTDATNAQNNAVAAFAEANSFQAYINSAYTTANAAFAKANTGGSGQVLSVDYIAGQALTANGGQSITITGNGAVVFAANSGTTSQTGVVMLNDTTMSNSNTLAATANSVNTVWGYAQSAFIEANSFQGFINSAYATANTAVVDATNAQNNAIAAFAEANSFQSFINSAFTRANAAVDNQFTFISNTSQPGLTVNNVITLTVAGNNTIILGANQASTTQVGVVELNDTTESNSKTTAATANAVNTAWAYAQSAFIEANSFQGFINSAYAQANTATIDATNAQNNAAAAFAEANSFQAYINSAYTTANAAFTKANSGGTGGALTVTYITDPGLTVNSGTSLTISGNGTVVFAANQSTTAQVGVVQLNDNETSNSNTLAATANSVNTTWNYAQSAFNTANASFAEGNSFQSIINSAFLQANAAFAEGNSFQSFINSAFTRANAAVDNQFTFISNTSQPGLTVNNVISLTVAGNNTIILGANQASTTQVGVVELTDSVQSKSTTTAATANAVNTAWAYAQSAFIEANSFQGFINSAFAQANAAFAEGNSFQSFINSAYTQANTATTDATNAQNNAAAAFAEANSFQAYINSAYTTANAAFAQANTGGGSFNPNDVGITIITGTGLVLYANDIITTSATLNGNCTFDIAANSANTTVAGVVQLNDTLTSISTTEAPTANMANTLWDYITGIKVAPGTFVSNNIIANNTVQSGYIQVNNINTNYTILPSDSGKVLVCSNTSAIVLTISNTLCAYGNSGFRCLITNANTGNVSFTNTAGANVSTTAATPWALPGQYYTASLFATSSNNFILDGVVVIESGGGGGGGISNPYSGTFTANELVSNTYANTACVQINNMNTAPASGIYSLSMTDSGTVIVYNNNNPLYVNTTNSCIEGFRCIVTQMNTGMVTIQSDPYTTLIPRVPGNTALAGINCSASLVCWTPNTFLLDGSIASVTIEDDWLGKGNTTTPASANIVNGLHTLITSSSTPKYANYYTGITGTACLPNSSSAMQMQSVGGTITPLVSGNVMIAITAEKHSSISSSAEGVMVHCRYGTGSLPGNNAPLTGTQCSANLRMENQSAACTTASYQTFGLDCITTGLTIGTSYWFDLAAIAITTASDVPLANITFAMAEI